MKLTQKLKNKIDDYFDNVTSEELYRLSIKYGITEIDEQLSINDVMQPEAEKVCDNCDGKGGRDFTDGFYPCPKCKGSGVTNL